MKSSFFPCPACGAKTYGFFPYDVFNDYGQIVRCKLLHCVNCGYEPEVKGANLVDPRVLDTRKTDYKGLE